MNTAANRTGLDGDGGGGDEDLLVDGAEHVLVAAENRLDHQIVDPSLDPACVVTLVIILICVQIVKNLAIVQFDFGRRKKDEINERMEEKQQDSVK